jgi:AcrR family transcriptional regulator
VLEAGSRLFSERGYQDTSIAEIGRRADIAKSVLYHYFGSKAGLYEAIVEAETRELVDRVAVAVPPDTDAPRLRAGVEAYLGFLAERPAAWRLLLRDPPSDPELVEVHRRLAAERTEALAALLATPGKRARSGPHLELVATAIRTFAAWWYEHREVPQQRITEAILDVAAAGARHLEVGRGAPAPG